MERYFVVFAGIGKTMLITNDLAGCIQNTNAVALTSLSKFYVMGLEQLVY